MALGTRELLLTLRARDEASRVLRSFANQMTTLNARQAQLARTSIATGAALSSIGVAMTAIGAAGAGLMAGAIRSSVEYQQQAAKTATQLDTVRASIQDLKDAGREITRDIPVPFEQIQGTFYDIFSSMDVTFGQGKVLATEFSKAAVAGQVDLQDAARGTIGLLNAFQLEAKDVNRVNDVMFQLVRKGVGDYREFSRAIGRASPSARRAGQDIEDLAGMMAFLTRNGLSTAMAATSAARALDAFSNPKTVGRLEEMGVTVKNAAGEFRPISEVVTDLGIKLSTLTGPERAAALQNLFKASGGTIQARRFFDIAVTGFDELNQRTAEMRNSTGAMQDSYEIMFAQPQTQIQLLKNNIEILRTELGDALMPVFVAVTKVVIEVVKAFNEMDESTKRMIAIGLTVFSTFTILAGIITTVAGGFFMLQGAAALAGISMGTVAKVIGGATGVFGLMVVAVMTAIKHWDALVHILDPVVNVFQNLIGPLVELGQVLVGNEIALLAISFLVSSKLAPALAAWAVSTKAATVATAALAGASRALAVAKGIVAGQMAITSAASLLLVGRLGQLRIAMMGLLATAAPFLAWVAAIALAVEAITSFSEANDKAEASTERFRKGLDPYQVSTYTTAVEGMRERMAALQRQMGWEDSANGLGGMADSIRGVIEVLTPMENSVIDSRIEIGRLRDESRNLEEEMGLIRSNVDAAAYIIGVDYTTALRMARDANIDVRGPMGDVARELLAYKQNNIDTTPAAQRMAEATGILGDEAATADSKLTALNDAMDEIKGGAWDVEEAVDNLTSDIIRFTEEVERNAESQAEGTRSLEGNSKAAVDNRARLRDMVGGIMDVISAMEEHGAASEDIQATLTREKARLEETFRQLGFNEEQVKAYTDVLLLVPGDVNTHATVTGTEEAAAKVAGLQKSIENLMSVPGMTNVMASSIANRQGGNPLLVQQLLQGQGVGRANGGPVWGPGGPRDDKIPAWLSNGEYVINADTVRALGTDFFDAINYGMKNGGSVKGELPLRVQSELIAQVYGDAVDQLKKSMAGGPGLAGQPMGVQQMMAVINGEYGPTRLISGFRPGAITATGKPSYHGKGRAVDLPPDMALFNFLERRFPNARELIFSPAGARQINNGRKHVYSGITRSMHWDHIHLAMKNGGRVGRRFANGGLAAKFARPALDQMPGYMGFQTIAAQRFDAGLGEAAILDVQRAMRERVELAQREVRIQEILTQLREADAAWAWSANNAKNATRQEDKDAAYQEMQRAGDQGERARQALRDIELASNLEREQKVIEGILEATKAREALMESVRERIADLTSRDISQVFGDSLGFEVEHLTENLKIQTQQMYEWSNALHAVRKRGLNEGLIEQMGLDVDPDSLGQLQTILEATDQQINELNRAFVGRQDVAAQHTAYEANTGRYTFGQPKAGQHIEIHQTINTQEIDPRVNALNLGYEVARRVR